MALLKKLRNKYVKQHPLILFLFLFYFAVAHLILPIFNNGNDYSFFSKWALFSNGPAKKHYDLSFDNGQTFIIRDHRDRLDKKEIDLVLLFYLINTGNNKKISLLYKEYLKKEFSISKVERFTLEGPPHKHILYKENTSTLSRKVIFND